MIDIHNLALLTELMCLYLPIVFGAYIVISLMQIPNLSIESACVIGAISGGFISKATILNPMLSLLLGLVCAMTCGATVGIATGLLHTYGKLSHLLCSIVIMGAMHGINLLLLGGTHLSLMSSQSPLKICPYIERCPTLIMLLIITAALCILIHYFLKTNLGLSCAVYGDNPHFFKHYNISSPFVICSGLAIGNALAAISGYLIAQNNNFVDTGMAVGIPLMCITALMMGKALCKGSKVIRPALPYIGTACFFIIQSLLLHSGFDFHYFPLVQAIAFTFIFLLRRSQNRSLLGI